MTVSPIPQSPLSTSMATISPWWPASTCGRMSRSYISLPRRAVSSRGRRGRARCLHFVRGRRHLRVPHIPSWTYIPSAAKEAAMMLSESISYSLYRSSGLPDWPNRVTPRG